MVDQKSEGWGAQVSGSMRGLMLSLTMKRLISTDACIVVGFATVCLLCVSCQLECRRFSGCGNSTNNSTPNAK